MRDTLVDTATRFFSSLEKLAEAGADPVAMAILFLIGLFIITNYRITMAKMKKKFQYGESSEDDSASSSNKPVTPVDLIPFMTILADYASSVEKLATAMIGNVAQLGSIKSDNETAHHLFKQEAVDIKSSVDVLNTTIVRTKEELMGVIIGKAENVLQVGIGLFDSSHNLIGWNGEGKEIFSNGSKKPENMLGKRVDSLGPTHTKCLGNNKTLFEVMEGSKKSGKTTIDILELSLSSSDDGKWNWYLTFVLPFLGSTMLLLLDVGDIHRGPIVKSPIIPVSEEKKEEEAAKILVKKVDKDRKKLLEEKEVTDGSKDENSIKPKPKTVGG